MLPTVSLAFELKVVTNDLESDIRDTSLVVPLALPTSEATAQDVVAAAQADYARLVGVLYDRGYFAPQVSILLNGQEASSLSPVSPPSAVRTVVLQVQTGPKFAFGQANLSPVARETQLPDGFASGQTATTRVMKKAVEAGIEAWRAQGHAKAALSSQDITARHNASQLDADIRLDPGPRLKFGKLRVSGNTRMREERIQAIAGLPTGQVFSPDEIEQSAARLRRARVFSVVSLTEADSISQGDTLDIDAQFSETKPRRFGFGAELSTQDGLGVSAFWLHRNLFGGAERLRVGGEINGIGGTTGGMDYEFTLAFTRPATLQKDTDFYAKAEISSLEEPNFSADRVAIEAGFMRYSTAQREYSLGVGYAAARTVDVFGARSYKILTLPASAELDYRDDPLNATKGYYAKASLTPFINIDGTANGIRSFLDARVYRSAGVTKRVTFALRGQVGLVSGPSQSAAPADFLFYSGGGGTVRGHDYQSLGIDLGGGRRTGGKSFLGLSGEVRVKTTQKLSVVGFYDAGFIGSDDLFSPNTGNWHAGAGLGVRYDTGIGPIRFDIGAPVSGPGNAKGVKIYIGIGQSF